MFQLNEDCLSDIFNNMSVSEQIYMARICTQFRNIVEIVLRRKFNILTVSHHLKRELKSNDVRMLLEIIDSHIKQLDILLSYQDDNYLPSIGFYLTLNLDSLVKLHLEGRVIEDHHIQLFAKKCKNLKSFSVAYSGITGRFVNEMKRVNELRFHICSVQPKQIKRILRLLPVEKLKIKYNFAFNLTEAMMSMTIPVRTLKQLYVSEGEYFGILLLEKFPLTTLIHKHPDADDDTYVYNISPPNELNRVRSNLQKITFGGSMTWSCIQYLVSYLHNTPPEMDFNELFSMNFLNSILHLIDCCSQFQCIETLFNIYRFSIIDVNRFIRELQRRNRTFRLVFCYSDPEYSSGLDVFQKNLQESLIYNLQNELTIEFKYDSECYSDHYVRYDMCNTNV